METIYIKKQSHPSAPEGVLYVVPAVGIRTREGMRLIPHPYGAETTTFETLDITLEQVHRAGYHAEFEGKQYPMLSAPSAPRKMPTLKRRHTSALMNIIESALPRLEAQLSDNSPFVVASAAQALGEMKATEAIPGLIHALAHDDIQVRKSAAEALAKMGKPAMGAVQMALKDKNSVVRHSAVTVLVELVHFHFDLLPEILPDAVALMQDDNWLVRSTVASLLGEAAKIQHQREDRAEAAQRSLGRRPAES